MSGIRSRTFADKIESSLFASVFAAGLDRDLQNGMFLGSERQGGDQ
jgi:hypothetical protein